MSFGKYIYLGPYVVCQRPATMGQDDYMAMKREFHDDKDRLICMRRDTRNDDRVATRHVWTSNRRDAEPSGRSWHLPWNDATVAAYDAADVQTDTAIFNSFYKVELHMLRKFYGTDNVAVRWGLLHFWMGDE
ncbi:hypothetical protein [Fimbriiglobus ruber]|uniref:Uncharacterized protein n=1 Tax=Fimbriiglobus ruber TaxID=1908690 RepID=A0A225DB16_9BACT|nr:hypothetical protein [Fimbriiglobus ruber]OWK34329.1 hypothetical protein FRUB_10300 [Fimbriiglobus ruber]